MALPANSGIDGWDLETLSTVLLYPRQEQKLPLVARSLLTTLDLVYTVRYELGNINLYNAANVLILQIPVNGVINVDLAFDQLNREVIVWELIDNQVWMYWYDPAAAAHVTLQIASGNNPCCTIDERRGILVSNSDVFIFYQRGDEVFYRLQRERYLIEHEIPHSLTQVKLETCGMGTNLRMTIRTTAANAHILMHGDKYMGLGSDYMGLPYGEIP